MALNSQWTEERKRWICLTPISGLCSQTLLCLIWGVGTDFGAHKGKKRGIFPWSREGFLYQSLGAAGTSPHLAFCLFVTVWKVCTFLGEGENASVSVVPLLCGASWGSVSALLRILLQCGWSDVALQWGALSLTINLLVCLSFHSPRPGPTAIPYREAPGGSPVSDIPSIVCKMRICVTEVTQWSYFSLTALKEDLYNFSILTFYCFADIYCSDRAGLSFVLYIWQNGCRWGRVSGESRWDSCKWKGGQSVFAAGWSEIMI